jgi:hypothetical protein
MILRRDRVRERPIEAALGMRRLAGEGQDY